MPHPHARPFGRRQIAVKLVDIFGNDTMTIIDGDIMAHPTLTRMKLQELLRQYTQERGKEFHLTALGYLGFYARDEAVTDSDVDIVFMTKAPNLFVTVHLREDLVRLPGCPVDIIRLRERMNPRLKSCIEREAVYV